jgi:hypothetical protein
MILLFVLIISVFLCQLNAYFGLFPANPAPFLFYLKIAMLVLLFFLFKLLLIRMLGALFYGKTELITEFLYNIFLMNIVSGVILIPIVIFMAYFKAIAMPILISASAILLISIYLYRLWRSFNISISVPSVSKLYFFAYLCSLELLPFILIFKVIIRK